MPYSVSRVLGTAESTETMH